MAITVITGRSCGGVKNTQKEVTRFRGVSMCWCRTGSLSSCTIAKKRNISIRVVPTTMAFNSSQPLEELNPKSI